MIEHTQHDTERTFSKLFYNLVTVADMLIVSHCVFLLVIVEAIVDAGVNAPIR